MNDLRTAPQPLTERERAVIRFALRSFASAARETMNAAAQDKEGRYFFPGAVESFEKDATDAEALLLNAFKE